MRGGLVLLTAALLAAPGSAHAGRTFYGWLYGSEVMPERGAELQSWITEENFDNKSETIWLFGAQIGITDQLELGLPFEAEWIRATDPMTMAESTVTRFSKFGVEARYRFVTQDPVDAPAVAPLLRVGVKRLVANRDGIRPEADFVLSYESGIVHALIDLGFIAELDADKQKYEFRPGAGVSFLASADADLRFGVEAYAELKSEGGSWYVAGPNMAWTHGRFWLSAAFGIGIDQRRIKNAPRVQWGIAF